MTDPVLIAGYLTRGQLIAVLSVVVVVVALISANGAMCWLYRRVSTEGLRQARREKKKKMSDVWVYQVYRPPPAAVTATTAPVSDPLRRGSRYQRNDNTRSSPAAGGTTEQQRTQTRREEGQVTEELKVTAELRPHGSSRVSDGCPSHGGIHSRDNDSTDVYHLNSPKTTTDAIAEPSSPKHNDAPPSRSPTQSSAPHSPLSDLDISPSTLDDLDKVSRVSLRLEDFTNDLEGGERGRRRKKRRGGRRGSSYDNVDASFPVAEFHNVAFDFAEGTAAVETVTDVDL